MRFHSPDQDLLLLAHNALPLGQKLLVQLHVVQCADCRKRLIELEKVSFQTAAALRGPGLPAWTPPVSGGAWKAARTTAGWFAALAVLLILSVLLINILLPIRFPTHHLPKPLSPNMGGGCRPDLPSDKCQ